MEIRAIYEKGVLRLLDPIELQEGQEVKLTLQTLSDAEITAKLAAAGLLAEFTESFEEIELDEAEIERLGRLFASEKSVAEIIDEDRGEY